MPKLDHIAIEVSNTDAAIDFYTSKLGFTLVSRAVNEEEHEEYCFLESEGTNLEILSDLRPGAHQAKEIRPPYCPHICFLTEDMDATMRELRDKNIHVVRGPLRIESEATWVYFADPDGNLFEYVQWLQ